MGVGAPGSASIAELTGRLEGALADPELVASARGLTATIGLVAGEAGLAVRFSDDGPSLLSGSRDGADIVVSGAEPVWRRILATPPPRGHQSFTALQLANSEVSVVGDALRIAQARPALERLFELLRDAGPTPAAPPVRRDLGQISGSYARMAACGTFYDVFVERAGRGTPVLLLHTAGADARQYQSLLSDTELASSWQLIAFDCPFHGRSFPPIDWDGGSYRLDQATYIAWVSAFIEQTVRERVVLVGCSMGAAITLVMAAERPDLLLGAVALEPPLRSTGRRNPYLAHACVAAGAHNSAYVRGMMGPASPEAERRRAAWIYAQGGPGVYTGDLAFYSDEFDGAVIGPRIDASRLPVHLLTGEYDYSASLEDGERLAALIPGSSFHRMPALGHFPMTEHPDLFRAHFVPVLETIRGRL